jgi:hypothetical protein
MRVTNLWKENARPTLSFEFFPPRSEKDEEKVAKVIDTLAELNPDFVSVTFGAGGSSREGSYQLVKKSCTPGKAGGLICEPLKAVVLNHGPPKGGYSNNFSCSNR